MSGSWSRGHERVRDEAFIRTLYQEHGRWLMAYAARATGDRWLAEDLVQETFLRAWRHPESFTGNTEPHGWLYTVLRNLIFDRARSRAVRPAEIPTASDSPFTTPVQPSHAQTSVDSIVVYQAVSRLSEDHRRVLYELYFQGRTSAEAAAVLGVPEGTVKSRTHSALRVLRRLVVEGRTD
ncbi:sigma-70 family RNA polymerase sigma factor [Lentzea sp. PSKA42]|jgi:RNA polymerase sigma-70 factor, ECF subfamily|uniref:Sigma-70 family RNA polymerase sigma factor n=1 Tax=Lentzea indica TaxID=2604800 RepID=A0ABX1FGW9_9PSEU|nr:sigma-70 family RNA polymerase sigma factor [Lentzea indica]NKE57853.1 sigma-70 family RNA polymerase sigma factor [Lentzea indica]